jgi:hypothetical protein
MKLIQLGKVKLTIFVLASQKALNENFTFEKENYICYITCIYVANFAEVKTILKKLILSGIKHDSIVLAPDHGVEDKVHELTGVVIETYPMCEWSHKDKQSYMITELNLCYKITKNVHYCTCSRAPHIEKVLNKVNLKGLEVGNYYCSGYLTYIIGSEKNTFDYIKAGCPVDGANLPNFNLKMYKREHKLKSN